MAHFETKKDVLTYLIFIGLPLVLLVSYVVTLVNAIQQKAPWPVERILGFAAGGLFLLFMVFAFYNIFRNTYYEINEQHLIYSIGWVKKQIPLTQIHWVVPSTYPSAGVRAAIAWNGVLIGYGAGYEVFISPKDPVLFRQQLEGSIG